MSAAPIGIREDLKRDEAVRLFVYDDKTGKALRPGDTLEGNATIGTGRNVSGIGITMFENDVLLDHDIARVIGELDQAIPWWKGLSDNRRRGLINMGFMGVPKLLLFTHMLASLHSGDGEGAAAAALDSHWANEVGDRATRIADLFREG